MRNPSTMCKIDPESPACGQWQSEVCVRCPDWQQQQEQPQPQPQQQPLHSTVHKMMTVDECQRLKRELQSTLFNTESHTNATTVLMLLFVVGFCVFLMIWLLMKAFLVRKPRRPTAVGICPEDRQSGGHASVDGIMKQLRTTSAKFVSGSPKKESFFVPKGFWENFSLSKPQKKASELATEDSEESSDDESTSDSRTTDVTNDSEEKTSDGDSTSGSSSSESGERSTADEDQTSITMDMHREAARCTNGIGKMPTSYGPPTTSNNQTDSKIRWANWLKRSSKFDYQV